MDSLAGRHEFLILENDKLNRLITEYGVTTEWYKKNGNFWKTQQKLKKSKKEKLLTEIELLQLAF